MHNHVCPSCDTVALPRMWCAVCFDHGLPERKFTKKERKGDSGVCVKCKGVVNGIYASVVGKKRKPSYALKKSARQDAMERARIEVCPGYREATEALEEERPQILALVEVRRTVRALMKPVLPTEIVLEVESFLIELCRGPHCERALWRWPIARPGLTYCFNCTCCVRKAKPWFPRIKDDPNPNLPPQTFEVVAPAL